MNWRNLFKPSDILTDADRAELEKLDASTAKLRDLQAKITREWPTAAERQSWLRDQAEELAKTPDDADLYRRMEITACMPDGLQTGWQHKEIVLGALGARIEEILQPSVEVVRRVLRRALSAAEAELKKVEARERKEAEAEGYNYSPSGKVQALQGRVLSLRNEVAAKYKFEGSVQDPAPWRERLAEWL